MQFILLTLLLISSFWSIESNDESLSFYKTLFNRQVKNECVPLTNDYCPLINRLHRILPSGINNIDWNHTFDAIPDDENLDFILILGLQQLALHYLDYPSSAPKDSDLIIQDLVRIVTTLSEGGSTAVTWKDLKPYFQKLISIIRSS